MRVWLGEELCVGCHGRGEERETEGRDLAARGCKFFGDLETIFSVVGRLCKEEKEEMNLWNIFCEIP